MVMVYDSELPWSGSAPFYEGQVLRCGHDLQEEGRTMKLNEAQCPRGLCCAHLSGTGFLCWCDQDGFMRGTGSVVLEISAPSFWSPLLGWTEDG